MKSVRRHGKVKFTRRFIALINHPLFWYLTFAGNGMIVLGGLLLYLFESESQGTSVQFIDCLLWSTSIVTTIGYASFAPATFVGKVIVIVLMLLGTFFLWCYMALLVSTFISPVLLTLEKEVQDVEKELSELKTDERKIQTYNKEFI